MGQGRAATGDQVAPASPVRSLERLGLQLVESTTITRPPAAVRAGLPAMYRYLLPLIDPVFRRALRLTLFRADSLRPADPPPRGSRRS
jgi:hypothetical protein